MDDVCNHRRRPQTVLKTAIMIFPLELRRFVLLIFPVQLEPLRRSPTQAKVARLTSTAKRVLTDFECPEIQKESSATFLTPFERQRFSIVGLVCYYCI